MPPAVATELKRNGFDPGRTTWLQIRDPAPSSVLVRLSQEVDLGEAEAMALAKELRADVLLIDELRGRLVARRESLQVVGILGILSAAKRLRLIPSCGPLVDALRTQANFWVSEDLRRKFLESEGE